ncbi:slipin family protein [Soonwooa sp.]|uniref:slipin family protein n=1 Tax=Soonwooa sp. TaxID=1938592 RepID=UPI00262512C9|nr:slipin family protein [Soonwooa sp.]
MKNLNVKLNEVALVFKNERLIDVLIEGKYWVGFGKETNVFELSKNFPKFENIDYLLKEEKFAALVDVVELKDNEVALMYENKNYVSVLHAGRHIFWKSHINREFRIYDTSVLEVDASINKNLYQKSEILQLIRVLSVDVHERGLFFVNGKMEKILDPGLYVFWKNDYQISLEKIDVRQKTLEILGQEILTKDKAQLRINFIAQYIVEDIEKALLENKEFEKQLYVMLQMAVRNFVGGFTLDQLMESKIEISSLVLDEVKAEASELGVKLISTGIKDIILPGEIKDIMNQVLVAEKKAQANTIMRREETASTRSLLNTAKLMGENQMLWKLKEMEYIEKISEKINTISVSGGGNIVTQLKEIFSK